MLTALFAIGIFISAAAIGVLLYWQLVVAEGAYLGTRVVALLYDWFAPRYDKVKQYDPASDAVMLAMPIMQHLVDVRRKAQDERPFDPSLDASGPSSGLRAGSTQDVRQSVVVLDVATGTGRLPDALLSQPRFHGRMVAIDASARMLDLAKSKLGEHVDRITFMQRDAHQLPFEDHTFDVVTCLEALEFMRDWRSVVKEALRVLKPGGLLMLSNRIGPDAWKLPGRVVSTSEFTTWLGGLGLKNIAAHQWLVDYDLVTGIK